MAYLGFLLAAITLSGSACHGPSAALPSLTAVRVMLADVERERQEHRTADAASHGRSPGRESPTLAAHSRPRPSILDARVVDYRAGRFERGFVQALIDSADELRIVQDGSFRRSPRPGVPDRATRLGPLPGFRQTLDRDLRRLPSQLWTDIKSVYTSSDNLLLLGGAYGAALALQSTGPDDTVADSLRDHRIFKDDWRDAFGAAGNPFIHFGVAWIWYVVGQQTQDEHTYQVAGTLQRALMVNGLSVLAGQLATGGHGPNGESGSFPSGHTSSTFTFASVMHRSYGPWVGMPLYALGGLVAMERLDSDEHSLSDVVMGTMMGLVIGHTIAGDRELELAGGHIVPYVDPQTQSSGLAWVVHFK